MATSFVIGGGCGRGHAWPGHVCWMVSGSRLPERHGDGDGCLGAGGQGAAGVRQPGKVEIVRSCTCGTEAWRHPLRPCDVDAAVDVKGGGLGHLVVAWALNGPAAVLL